MEEAFKYSLSGRFRKSNDLIVGKKDKEILRNLAQEKADIASSSIHAKKIDMWKALNRLEDVRPLVWINEIPWYEMNIDDEFALKTST